ncbi:MAG: hypothetical protein P0S95_04310 [Rhabdochlamydiaceae bacterium]|nr:hypothetical protein [Candidatus Amphrikana amoebophyrae]
MNFTREPIIETIITPKDGFKLVVTNSKGNGDEYSVDALEVVSFGDAIFYRSFEKPKAFLLPVSDFEVIEVRETRVALKNVSIDKTIKIAGGKDASKSADSKKNQEESSKKKKTRKKKPQDKPQDKPQEKLQEKSQDKSNDKPQEKAQDNNKEKSSEKSNERESKDQLDAKNNSRKHSHMRSKSSFDNNSNKEGITHVRTLIPPPTTLISETISRYKPADEAGEIGGVKVVSSDKVENKPLPKSTNHETSAPSALDPIWMDDIQESEQNNELKEERFSKEPIILAPPPIVDEPIGKTHAEERLKDEPDTAKTVSELVDDQK